MADGTLIAGHMAGRIQPSQWTPPDGDWCFLIGSEDDAVEEAIEVGDRFDVTQVVDLTNVSTISFAFKFRNTSTPSIDFVASFLVSDTELWSERISHGEVREYARRTINVSQLGGDRKIAMRLEAVSP